MEYGKDQVDCLSYIGQVLKSSKILTWEMALVDNSSANCDVTKIECL